MKISDLVWIEKSMYSFDPNLGIFSRMMKSLHPSLLWQRLFLFSCFIGATVHGSVVAFGRPGRFRDFDFHRDFGAHFLSGEYLYSNAYLYPYMPSAAMFFAPLALLDSELAERCRECATS